MIAAATARGARAARAALRRLAGEQRGLTVVEAVVAALLLVVGALAVLQVFDVSNRNNFRAEQSQVVSNRLQAELEQVRQLPYAEIALTGYPQGTSGENDPLSRVAGTQFVTDRDGATGSEQELVVNGGSIPGSTETVTGGAVEPGPVAFTSGDVSGEIYRFVTWADPAEGGMKRVIVAAKVDDVAVSFDRRYQEIQSDVPDPGARPDPNPGPPGEEDEGNTVELWLTDTSCDKDAREIPAVPHDAHNTRARCADGEGTGTDRGAPDLMFTEAPPEVDPENDPPLDEFDLATDVGGSEDDVGLTMPWGTADSCLLQPVLDLVDIRGLLEGITTPLIGSPDPLDGVLDLVEDDTKHTRVHTWLSPKVEGDGGVLTGEGTLDLWTRTVNGAIHPGEICVTMFIRQTVQVPVLPQQLCLPLLGCHDVDLGLVDLSSNPPQLCLPLLGCHDLELSFTTLEVDVPVANVGLLTDQNGVVCDQGLNLTYFRCSMNQWPTDWSKVSIPMSFLGVNAAGQLIPQVLPPESQVGISLMVKRSGTQPGQGLEFMYDHADFESRLQLETDSLISFPPVIE